MSVHLIQVVRVNPTTTTATTTTATTNTASSSSASTLAHSSVRTSGSSKSHHKKQQLPRERLFLKFNNDTTLDMTVTDMIRVYQGKLHRSFVEVSEDNDKPPPNQLSLNNNNKQDGDAPKTLETMIREALTSLDSNSERTVESSIEGEIRDAEEPGKWILSIKKRRGESAKELIRLAEVILDETPNANITENLCNFLDVCIRERNEREESLARESRLRESEMEKSRMYCVELLNKANERDQVTNELTKRFLAILNTKKEKIHELMEQIQELEAVAMETRDESAKQRESHEEADDVKNEQAPKPKKPRGRPAAKSKNTEKDEAQAKLVAAKARRIAESTELKKPKKARIQEEEDDTEAKPESNETPSKADTAGEQSEPLHRVNTRSSTKRNSNGGPATTTQEASGKPMGGGTTTAKSKSSGPITEDEFGPLPPGWEVTTSRTTGKRCYQNKILGKKQYARPTAPTASTQNTATQSTQDASSSSSSSKKKKHTIVDDDEDGDPASKILKDFL